MAQRVAMMRLIKRLFRSLGSNNSFHSQSTRHSRSDNIRRFRCVYLRETQKHSSQTSVGYQGKLRCVCWCSRWQLWKKWVWNEMDASRLLRNHHRIGDGCVWTSTTSVYRSRQIGWSGRGHVHQHCCLTEYEIRETAGEVWRAGVVKSGLMVISTAHEYERWRKRTSRVDFSLNVR